MATPPRPLRSDLLEVGQFLALVVIAAMVTVALFRGPA
jgi:hypothetical protein